MFVQKMPQLVLSAITIGIFCFALPINSEAAKEAKATKKSLAVESTSQGQGDETAVKAQVGALNKSLANGDAKTLASLWTEDGDYIGVDGAVCKGRAALEKRFTGLMAENDKQQVELLVDHVRFPAANVGLLEGVVRRNNSSEGPVPETRFSMIFVKQNGQWLISNATETPLIARGNTEPLNQLSWLIGEWSAEQSGGSVHMKAEWAANKNFIACQYQVQKSADSPKLESRQLIGWDPRSEQPISWHFDSSGGFGYGTWLKKDKQWMVNATGVDRDGSTTNALNVLSIADPDNFSWQSTNRSINGIVVNDTAPLKVHRVTR